MEDARGCLLSGGRELEGGEYKTSLELLGTWRERGEEGCLEWDSASGPRSVPQPTTNDSQAKCNKCVALWDSPYPACCRKCTSLYHGTSLSGRLSACLPTCYGTHQLAGHGVGMPHFGTLPACRPFCLPACLPASLPAPQREFACLLATLLTM